MAVVDIQAELAARNPRGAKTEVEKALRSLDKHTRYLRLAADSASLVGVEEPLVMALYEIHSVIRTDCERLMQLL